MKKYILFFTMILTAALVSCEDDKSPLSFSVDNTAISVPDAGAYVGFVIHTLEEWTVTKPSGTDWISFTSLPSGKYSKKVGLKVEENMNGASRTATLVVSCEGETQEVIITQDGLGLILSTPELSVDFIAGSYKVAVRSGGAYSATSSVPWITASTDADGVTVVVGYNADANTRTGVVDITYGSITKTLRVVQDGWRLRYQDFLGTYTMHYGDGNNYNLPPNRNSTLTIELVAAGSDRYYVKGILNAEDQLFGDIVMAYNNGNLEWRTHKVFARTAEQNVIWGAYSQPVGTSVYFNSWTTGAVGELGTVGMYSSEYEVSPAGELQSLTFVDLGTWSYPMAGFKIRNYNGSTNSGDVIGMNGKTPSSYYFPMFVKQ